MHLQNLDDSILERILQKLPPGALCHAELVCQHWSAIITRAQLWQQYTGLINSSSSGQQRTAGGRSGGSAAHTGASVCEPWRMICLHRAATAKWCSGRLAVSATISGHTGPVTCMAVLDDIVITGSSDGTARVWDLGRGTQQQLLRMPSKQSVTAVALPSVSLAVTATAKGGAVLWRAGAPIRRFEPLPGGSVTCLSLTDTQLLMGSSSGVVQHFDLFSGQQQLITRHSSGVAALLTHKQQQQQQQQQQLAGLDAEDWLILVGCVDGQVSCISSTTGRLLWQLPTRYPSRVISMHLVNGRPTQHHSQHALHRLQPQSHQHQQQTDKSAAQQPGQQQRERVKKAKRKAPQQVAQQQEHVLLHVLNARSQVICWQLPKAALEPASAAAAAAAAAMQRQCTAAAAAAVAAGGRTSTAGSSTGPSSSKTGSAARDEHQYLASNSSCRMPLWPLSVAFVTIPTSPQPAMPQSQQSRQDDSEQQQQQGRCQLLQASSSSYTCMVSALFGTDCLLVGSSVGYLAVVQLQQPGATGNCTAAAAAASGVPDGNGPGPGQEWQAGSHSGAAAAAAPAAAEAGTCQQTAGVQQQSAPSTEEVTANKADADGALQVPVSSQLLRKTSQDDKQPSEAAIPQLAVVRHYPLHKLGRMLAGRQAASLAAHHKTLRSSPSGCSAAAAVAAAAGQRSGKGSAASSREADQDQAAAQALEHMMEGSKVCCMQFAPGGQLLVGLGSGHVCCLIVKHAAGSVWS